MAKSQEKDPALLTPFLSGHSVEKPASAVEGTLFYEVDTGHRQRFTNNEWVLVDNVNK